MVYSVMRDETHVKIAKSTDSHYHEVCEQLAYAFSHDLIAPLRVIEQYLRLIDDNHINRLEPELRSMIGQIAHEKDRMKSMFDATMQYLRVDTGRKSFKDIPLDALIDEAQTIVKEKVPGRQFHVDTRDSRMLRGSKPLLRTLFAELLTNAVKFCEAPQARIVISVTDRLDSLQIHIEDNCPPIPEEHAEIMFVLFQRLHPETVPGNGAGLAITQRIMEVHGGSLSHSAVAEGGNRFTLTFPRHLVKEVHP